MANGGETGRSFGGRMLNGARIAGQAFMVASAVGGGFASEAEISAQNAIVEEMAEIPGLAVAWQRDRILEDIEIVEELLCGDYIPNDGTAGVRDFADPETALDYSLDIRGALYEEAPREMDTDPMQQVSFELAYNDYIGAEVDLSCESGSFAPLHALLQDQIAIIETSPELQEGEVRLGELKEDYDRSVADELAYRGVALASAAGYLLFKERKPRSKGRKK